MNLPRISRKSAPTSILSWILLYTMLAQWLPTPTASFLAPFSSRGLTSRNRHLICVSKPTATHKHRPSDRYSSQTHDRKHVADQVSNLYENGNSYRKTIRKTKKVEESSLAAKNKATTTSGSSSTGSSGTSKATIPSNEHILNQLNRYPALILNADYQPMSYLPLSVCHWQEAVKSIFSGKVTVVDVYEGVMIRAANLEIPLPSVIALNEFVPQCSHRPAFTRRNVFLRDEYRCQYCNDRFPTKDLSIDHVVPRCMGGQLNWENAVTSCLTCNGRKGNKLVKDLKHIGMKLHAEPRAPTRHELAVKAGKMLPRKVHSTWQPYLTFMETSNDDENDESMSYYNHDLNDYLDNDDQNASSNNGMSGLAKERKTTSKNQKKKLKKSQQQTQEQEAFVRR